MTKDPSPRRRLVGNFLSLSGSEILSKLLTLAAFAYIARVAGPAGFGALEFAASIVLCAGLVVDQGLGVYGAREIARNPEATTRLVTEVAVLRLALAAAVYFGLVVFVVLLDRPAVVEQLVLIYGLGVFLSPLMLQWVFQGHDRMRVVAIMQVLRQAAFAAVVLALFRDPDRLWLVAVGELAGAAAVVAVSVWLARQSFDWRQAARPVFSRAMLRGSVTIGLGQLFWSLRIYGATVVLGLIASSEDVGFFGAALRIAVGLNAFVWLYFFNLLPSLSRSWNDGPERFGPLVIRSLRTVGWLALAAGMLWVLLSGPAIRLVYGQAFAPATTTLQWLSGVCILGAFHGHYRFGLIASGQERYATLATGLGTVVALAAIPPAYARLGIEGAAMALVVGEAAVWLAAWRFGRRLHLQRSLAALLRPAIVALPVSFLVWRLAGEVPTAGRVLLLLGAVAVGALGAEPGFRRAARGVVARPRDALRR